MARPRTVTDEQILSTVRDYALEQGAKVSLDDIAARLSVSTPALLKRFGSRRRIMIEALRPPFELPPLGALDHDPTSEPLRCQLETIFDSFTAVFGRTVPCLMVLRESGIPESEIWGGRDKPTPKAASQAMLKWLRSAKTKGLVKADELEAAAGAMVGAMISRIAMSHMLKHTMSSREHRSYIKDLASLFCRALSSTKEEERFK